MSLTLHQLGDTRCLDPGALASTALADGGKLHFEGLYVHVPFCFHKCHYCDFYSITRQTPERMARFVELLLEEATLWAPHVSHRSIRTVFFGGGTPSLLPQSDMLRLINGLRHRLDLLGVVEFTVECNPATVSPAWLEAVREAGVDRLSFGAQSFDPADLAALERHHDPEDVPRSLEMAREAGFERLNLDLIYGVPGQTLDSWGQTLARGLACGTRHISAYLLTYEANTPLAVRRRLGQVVPAPEELELRLLRYTRQTLGERGLPAYEISNFAAPGDECLHNLTYWRGSSYLGLGPAAASHWQGWRWRNRPHLGEWERSVEARGLPAIEVEQLDAHRRRAEMAYLRLRLREGVPWSVLGESARARFGAFVDRYVRAGLLSQDSERFWLTEDGVPVADGLSAELLTL